ncbi:MAG: hypothetical protein LBD25_07530 [Coriobacteriales bacterium]|jgi:hypothetical protein|nr:hypothetical protein [Coriobacteriales bacterium]
MVVWLEGLGAEDYRNFFEMLFLVCFGIAWPLTVLKSYRSRTTKGKSLAFTLFGWFGYLFGITARILGGAIDYPLVFYFLNMGMVSLDLLLYARNHRIDLQREQRQAP